jgi:DNA repair protein RadC
MAEELLQLKKDSSLRNTDGGFGGFGGIAGLLGATADDLKRVKGLGPAKRAEIVAVLELARRAMAQKLQEREVFADPNAVKHYMQLYLANKPHEVFAVLFLDAQNRLLAMEELFRGTLTQPIMARTACPTTLISKTGHSVNGSLLSTLNLNCSG